MSDEQNPVKQMRDAARNMLHIIATNPMIASRWPREDLRVLERVAAWEVPREAEP